METRNKSNTEFRNEVSEILTPYESSFETLNHNYNQLHSTMQTVLTELQALRVNSSTHLPNPPKTLPDGFTKQNSTLNLKILPIINHRWYTKFKGPLTWDEFTKVVHLQFGPTDYENPSEALSRLKQMTTIQSYQEAFEKLSYKVDNLPKNFLIGCFIEGLRDDIRLDVNVKQPWTLADTIGMARLIEERNTLQKKKNDQEAEPELIDPRLEISLHTMSCTSHPQTIRVVGRMKNKDVTVLIDGGSTHNFIDHTTTTKLGLPIVSDKNFQVMVGNGEQQM
ncbi:hypothetical protein ACOSQ2_028351 [Xanthoceras sorbifolium]